MLIRCPTCHNAHDLPPTLLTRPGMMLRCAHCGDSWTANESEAAAKPSWPTGRLPHDGPEIVAEARSARLALAAPTPRVPQRRIRHDAQGPRSPALAIAAILTILAGGMLATARKDLVVRLCPPSAGLFEALGLPVNLRGLALADMHGTVTAQGTRPVLTLQGRISNLRGVTTKVPSLRIAVRDKTHNELYSWTAAAPKPRLDAGETVIFRSRLAAPPADGQELMVSFADNAGPSAQAHSDAR